MKKKCIHNALILSSLLTLFFFISCGGGGGDGGGHPPTISNFEYSPRSTTVNAGGGSIKITGSINFHDSGGDVSSIRLTTFDSAYNVTNDLTTPISGVAGALSGTISLQVTVRTTPADVYRYEIYISDSQGIKSNTLVGYFPITLTPSSNTTVLI